MAGLVVLAEFKAEGDKGLSTFLHERFTGLGASLSHVLQALDGFRNQWGDLDTPWMWSEDKVRSLALHLRCQLFPIHIAANKADSAKERLGMQSRPTALFSQLWQIWSWHCVEQILVV